MFNILMCVTAFQSQPEKVERASSYNNKENHDPAASNARLVPATRLTVPVFVVETGRMGPVLEEAELIVELTVE
jgi:hypothetical protein